MDELLLIELLRVLLPTNPVVIAGIDVTKDLLSILDAAHDHITEFSAPRPPDHLLIELRRFPQLASVVNALERLIGERKETQG